MLENVKIYKKLYMIHQLEHMAVEDSTSMHLQHGVQDRKK